MDVRCAFWTAALTAAMVGETLENATAVLEGHESFEATVDGSTTRFVVSTTQFDTTVTVDATDGRALRYAVVVRFPMLSSATADEVGDAVEAGWFETMDRRLADAPMATRESVTLEEYSLERENGGATVRFAYTHGEPERAAAIAKTLGEYVEGTYVEGVIPGYAYVDPVADLLARASQGEDDGRRGPTPL